MYTVYMYVTMYLCMYVCMYVHYMYVCNTMHVHVWYTSIHVYVHMYVCAYVCMYMYIVLFKGISYNTCMY